MPADTAPGYEFLRPTPVIDFDSAMVQSFIREHSREGDPAAQRVIALYYAVRDRIRYDPYTPSEQPADFAASRTLQLMRGWCVPKSILYAACCRALGVPARLGYADVRNHLSTANLRRQMGTDVFYWHGYTSVHLEGRWVKATPAFNIELCDKFGFLPLEFDGENDSLYQPFDREGRRHMEYVNERGEYADPPIEAMVATFREHYPHMMADARLTFARGDFDEEVAAEVAPQRRPS